MSKDDLLTVKRQLEWAEQWLRLWRANARSWTGLGAEAGDHVLMDSLALRVRPVAPQTLIDMERDLRWTADQIAKLRTLGAPVVAPAASPPAAVWICTGCSALGAPDGERWRWQGAMCWHFCDGAEVGHVAASISPEAAAAVQRLAAKANEATAPLDTAADGSHD